MEVHRFPEPDGESIIMVIRNFLSVKEAAALFNELEDEKEWIQGKFMQHMIPRLVRWYETQGRTYKFSGKTYHPMPYSPKLRYLQHTLAERVKALQTQVPELNVPAFHSVLVNKYRGTQDSISPHSDNEPELGIDPTIVSINLGMSRLFVLKRMTPSEWKKSHKNQPYPKVAADPPLKITLNHRDCIIMAGRTQHYWFHSVPKEPDDTKTSFIPLGRNRLFKLIETQTRYNLTFRPYP